ncbi:hypothetical protein LCGC14_2565810 [marine sediment metagenome]|uniref:Uncharacterized protein n=1 Tax=marine sediment metagenome TaxID=412755 RepID=A0A0F9AJ78_9ZZZZ
MVVVPFDKDLIRLIHDLAQVAKDAPDDLRAVLIETIRHLNNPLVSLTGDEHGRPDPA